MISKGSIVQEPKKRDAGFMENSYMIVVGFALAIAFAAFRTAQKAVR
jgi:hypothetical protein